VSLESDEFISDAFIDVAGLDEVPEMGVLGADGPDGRPICLVRLQGQVSAFADECTHQAFPLSAGEVRADGTLECVWHGARFDCLTGAVRREPATDDLIRYPVRIAGDRVLVGPAGSDA
jgi:3-phenylpropionate/trans-cinnamate dioxygenase ferredoxin subunit